MKFDNEIYEFILAKKFSNGLDVDFSKEKYEIKSRIDKILELTKNKSVIHIGFADHLPLIDEKIRKNTWLHSKLIDNTKKCIGIDINKDAVEYLKSEYNIDNIHNFDIEKEIAVDTLLEKEKYDYILLGEVIEHVDNPVLFLKNIHEKFKDYAYGIIVTAPNVFNTLTINDIRRGCENINTDHRYWFSPYTLVKIMTISGFVDCDLTFVEQVKLPFITALRKRLRILSGKPVYLSGINFSTLFMVSKLK